MQKPYYITTAINYANGPAHMGHAYEGLTADMIARYYRISSPRGCYFVTGSDEHGQKIAGVAEGQGLEPIDICDKYVNGFKVLNQRELVSNDDYVRTTSNRHKRTCKKLWKMCSDKGDIYLDKYEGWYNVREETFVTENEAKLTDFKDPTSGLPLKKVCEASYFFRMSKYQKQLVAHIESNPECIQPETQRKFILTRLKDDLRDLSISRTTFKWGIPVPSGFEEGHVMYVWFDALTNYLTGVDGLSANGSGSDPSLPSNWPADCHLIGKDIIWFHCVIWPCMLMSAEIPLPKTVFAHGFVNDSEGKKMSKSIGNTIDPHDMLDKYQVDSFRWYLAKECPFGGELSFSEESLSTMHNADLCDTLGNLVHRATNLCHKYCGGVIPDVPLASPLPVDLDALRDTVSSKMTSFNLDSVASAAIAAFRDINKYLTDTAPWKMKGEENEIARKTCVRMTLEAIYACTHLLAPFIPSGAGLIFDKLSTPPVCISELRSSLDNLKVGASVKIGDVLYTKIVSEEERNAEEAKKKKAEEIKLSQKKKKEKKAKEAAKSVENNKTATGNSNQSEWTKMEIRVGKIGKVWNHENADKLFCEEIDVGEGEPRKIASGLREHYTLEEMAERKVLVVCNLKSSKMLGFDSQGMVLAAKGEKKVELVEVPEGAEIGERVFIEGLEGEPFSAQQVKKKKVWNTVSKNLKCDGAGKVIWDGEKGGNVMTKSGECTVKSVRDAMIS